jgi:hypothetical protein
MVKWKKMPDGSLAAPVRGDPPKECPEGYMKHPGNEWSCIPDVPCVFRLEKITEGCCKLLQGLACDHFGEEIHIDRCLDCEERKPPNSPRGDDVI